MTISSFKLRKIAFFSGYVLIALFSFQFLQTNSAQALSNRFPDPSDFSQDVKVKMAVARADGVSYLLDAPASFVRIYVPDTNPNLGSIIVNNAGYTDGIGDAGAVPTDFRLYYTNDNGAGSTYTAATGTFGSPAGAGNITINYNKAGAPASIKHAGYRVYQLNAIAISGVGWNTFFITAPAGTIVSYFSSRNSANGDKFALKSNNGSGRGSFNLRFATECGYPGGIERLRFFDADAGQPNQGTATVNTVLTNVNSGATTTYNIVDNPSSLPQQPLPDVPGTYGGGQSERGFFETNLLGKPARYNWTWNNINEDNGIQFDLPYDGFDYIYVCPPPPPPPAAVTYCQINATNFTTGQVFTSVNDQTFDVTQGDNVQVEVFSHNGTGETWNNTNAGASMLVYFHDGVPTAFTEGNGRIHKYGDNTVAPFDFNHGPVGNGGNSAVAGRGGANTASSSAYQYTVNHLVSFGAGGATWATLASCIIRFNVLPPPSVPIGNITSANCSRITFDAGWWVPKAQNLNVTLTIVGYAPKNFVVAPGNGIQVDTFNDPAFANIPLHLGGYTVQLELEGASIDTYALTGVPCVGISCTTNNGIYEFGDPNPYTINYRVRNDTNRSDNRYDVALTSPPGGVISKTLNANAFTDYTTSFTPVANVTVIGTLRFSGGPTSFTDGCVITIQRYPYLKAYGADIMTGGGFGPTCNTQSGIFARIRPTSKQPITNRSGSTSQLGAFAWDDISGFATASLRDTAPAAVNGNRLSFAGTSFDVNSQTDVMGGNLTGNPACIPDYYNTTQYPAGSPVRVENPSGNLNNNAGFNSKQVFYNYGTAPATVKTATMNNYSGKTTFYVNGDLEINGNIIYNNSSGYGSIANIPNLTIVVLGNIYVDRSVSQLDGIYIAQPLANGTKGRIYTCAVGSTVYTTPTAVYDNCSGGYGVAGAGHNVSKLVVNGSFIAKKVIFNRAINTLNDSTFKEPYANSNGAETFIFTPEVFLSPPLFRPVSSPTSGDYNSIAVLPPIL